MNIINRTGSRKTDRNSYSGAFMLLLAATFFCPNLSYADNISALSSFYNFFWGTQSERLAIKNCTASFSDSNLGIFGYTNLFFCELEKLGLNAPTSATGKTIGYMAGTTPTYLQAIVSGSAGGGAYSSGSDTYDFEVKIWACAAATTWNFSLIGTTPAWGVFESTYTEGSIFTVDCTQNTNFDQYLYMLFSYSADHSINKGVMVQNQQAFYSSPLPGGSWVNLNWDLGTSSTNKFSTYKYVTTQVQQVATVYTLQNAYNWYGSTSVSGTQVNSFIYQDTNYLTGTNVQERFFSGYDSASNSAEAYIDIESSPNSTEGDAIPAYGTSTSACYTRTADATTGDWTYAVADSSTCPDTSTITFPNVSTDTANSWTITAMGNGNASTYIDALMQANMSANPSTVENPLPTGLPDQM